MASSARTVNATTTAADFATLDDPVSHGRSGRNMLLLNVGTNPVWVHADGGTVAGLGAAIVAEADDMACIPPNYGSLVMPYRATIALISTGGASKVNVVLDLGV